MKESNRSNRSNRSNNEWPRRAAHALAGVIGAAFGLLGPSAPTFASQIENTSIALVGVGPYYDNLCGYACMLIALGSTPAGSSCLMNAGWHYAIDIRTAEGRVTAGAVLAAKASGATVQVVGTNGCVVTGRVEVFDRFVMQ